MTPKLRRVVLGGGVMLYLFGLGFLGGIVAERVRFDQQRTAGAPSPRAMCSLMGVPSAG